MGEVKQYKFPFSSRRKPIGNPHKQTDGDKAIDKYLASWWAEFSDGPEYSLPRL